MTVYLLGGIALIIGLAIVLFGPSSSKASGFIILALGIGAVGRAYQQSKQKKSKSNMNCPKDNTSMEKGFDDSGFWVSGDKPKLAFQVVPGRKSKFMTAWRCPKCGKVELATDPD